MRRPHAAAGSPAGKVARGGGEPVAPLLLALAMLASPAALAAELAVDLFLGAGPGGVSAATAGGGGELAGRLLLEAGGAIGMPGSGLALAGAANLGFGGPQAELGAWLGIRSTWGWEAFSTWVDLDAALRVTPALDLGPRAALGARYEFAPSLALYATGAGQLGLLRGLRADLSLTVGLMGLFISGS